MKGLSVGNTFVCQLHFSPIQSPLSDLSTSLITGLQLPSPARKWERVKQREALTQFLLEKPSAARQLRSLDTATYQSLPPAMPIRLANLALRHGILESNGYRWRLAGPAAKAYIFGAWLEELAALGLAAAGAQEVRCGQRVIWRAGTDGSEHMNEIDAMAMTENGRAVLVSCKATAELLLQQSGGDSRLFDALQELAYWNAHFAKGRAISILVTTSDFYDEERKQFRSPKLVERARVMNLHVVSADYANWPRFSARLRNILDTADGT